MNKTCDLDTIKAALAAIKAGLDRIPAAAERVSELFIGLSSLNIS